MSRRVNFGKQCSLRLGSALFAIELQFKMHRPSCAFKQGCSADGHYWAGYKASILPPNLYVQTSWGFYSLRMSFNRFYFASAQIMSPYSFYYEFINPFTPPFQKWTVFNLDTFLCCKRMSVKFQKERMVNSEYPDGTAR